jgi:hypothetical protein
MDEVEHYRAGISRVTSSLPCSLSPPIVAALLPTHSACNNTKAQAPQMHTRMFAMPHVLVSTRMFAIPRVLVSEFGHLHIYDRSGASAHACMHTQTLRSDHKCANGQTLYMCMHTWSCRVASCAECVNTVIPALTVSGIGCVVENNHNNEMHVSVVVKGGAAHQSGIQEVLPCPRLPFLDFALQELNQTNPLNTGAPVLCVCTCERAASSRERRTCVFIFFRRGT